MGILLLVDVTNRESFTNLEHWIQNVSRYTRDKTKLLILASKCEDSANRKVWNEEILELLEQMQSKSDDHKDRDIQFVEISSKNDHNVMQAVNMIVRSVLKNYLDQPQINNNNNAPLRWQEMSTNTGQKYYYNAETRRTQWTVPVGADIVLTNATPKNTKRCTMM